MERRKFSREFKLDHRMLSTGTTWSGWFAVCLQLGCDRQKRSLSRWQELGRLRSVRFWVNKSAKRPVGQRLHCGHSATVQSSRHAA